MNPALATLWRKAQEAKALEDRALEKFHAVTAAGEILAIENVKAAAKELEAAEDATEAAIVAFFAEHTAQSVRRITTELHREQTALAS